MLATKAESSPVNYGGKTAGRLQIVKRRQRAFKIRGLTWIVERTFARFGRNRRFSKDYEYRVQTPRLCSTLPPRVSCSIGSHQHETFQTSSEGRVPDGQASARKSFTRRYFIFATWTLVGEGTFGTPQGESHVNQNE